MEDNLKKDDFQRVENKLYTTIVDKDTLQSMEFSLNNVGELLVQIESEEE